MIEEEERILALEEENQKLKSDNDKLLEIISQMRGTLNRLITRYVSKSEEYT